MTQHKWHKEIHAWADGYEIECQDYDCDDWYLVYAITCFGDEDSIFRFKQQLKEKKYLYAYSYDGLIVWAESNQNIADRFVFIGKIEVQDE